MNLYQLHGLLQMIAFLILFPIGAMIALFRDKVGSNWKLFHVGTQIIAICVVIAAYIVIKYAKSKQKNKKHNDKDLINKIHITIGYTIGILIAIQVAWAYLGKRIVDWSIWYTIHMILSACIIVGGIINIIVAYIMMKS